MVSTSTRRLPSTSIEAHGLGGGRRGHKHGRQRGGDRHGEHDQGGQQAPPHSHSNIHAQRALVIPVPDRTPTNRQIPIRCPACSQFCRGGKRPIAVQFHFHSKTLPIGHVIKKAASRCRQMQDVVIGGKHHQHQHQTQPDPEPHLLRPVRQGAPAHGLDRIEQKVTAIEQRHRKQVQQARSRSKAPRQDAPARQDRWWRPALRSGRSGAGRRPGRPLRVP